MRLVILSHVYGVCVKLSYFISAEAFIRFAEPREQNMQKAVNQFVN